MNIFKLFNEVIQWCDGNVGFLNVILSICTLTLTITIAKIPYKKKIVGSLDVTLEKIENETSYKSIIKVYLTKVTLGAKGPVIMLSRKHYGFVKRLFEQEIPEIINGTIDIYQVVREPGIRCKVALISNLSLIHI